MRFRTYIIVPTVTYGFWKLAEFTLINQEAKMSFEQRCRKYGYDTERHFVTTDDGYILQIFRLVGKNKDLNHHPSPPVLLQHGYMDNCYSMICNCEKSPAIYLANNGIDVWVGNNRGGSYSKFHRTLVLDVDSKYSDYSFEDMGLYDTKAMIEHISKETKTPKVSYVGFSQGGTQMFYGLALNNEWFKNHLSLFVALASPVNCVSEYPKPSDEITARSTINRVCKYLRNSQYASKFGKKLICLMMKLYPDYGRNYSSDISEGKPELNDVESLQRAKFYYPDGFSQKNSKHWDQITKNKQARRYDYGEEENLKRYGTNEPPLVDISQIRDVPIAVFGGKYDLCVPLNDSLFIKNNLHPSVLKHYEECEAGHQTFIVGKEATYIEKVAELIKEYSK